MTSTRRLVVSYVAALAIIAGWSTLSFGELRTFLNRQQDVADPQSWRSPPTPGMRADTQTASQPQRTAP